MFSKELQKKLEEVVARYETQRAALLEVLHEIMDAKGHVSLEDEKAVAVFLGVSEMDVREVMTFYTLFYDKERAQIRFNVCRTLSCQLRGSAAILAYLEEKLGIKAGEISKDGRWSIQTVECLGACEHAPVMQVNDQEYVGCLTKEKIDQLIQKEMARNNAKKDAK